MIFAGILMLVLVSYGYDDEKALENLGADIETLEYIYDDSITNGNSLYYCEPIDTGEDPYWGKDWGLRVGDARDMHLQTFEFYNFMYRSYMAFDLNPIKDLPAEAEILEIRLRLYLIDHYGHRNNYQHINFPYWDGYEQSEHPCTLSHVLLGDSLGVEDWSAGDPSHSCTLESNLGVVVGANCASPCYDPYQADYNGYYYMDVTDAVFEDIDAGRDESHFRIAFLGIESDYDEQLDFLCFSPCGWPQYKYPYFEVDYILPEEDRSESRAIAVETSRILITPNPASSIARVEYDLNNLRGGSRYSVYNIRGQKVSEGDLYGSRGEVEINLKEYPSGSYIFKTGNSYSRFSKVK